VPCSDFTGNDLPETRAFDRGDRRKARDLVACFWIRKFARLDAQRPELWALQPPSRRANRSKWLDLAVARREKTIVLATIKMPRLPKIASR
jgi:hypothetical protein